MSKVVLITGCSTGIGRDLAIRLSESGYAVVATARNPETLINLEAALKLPLDVTQTDSVRSAVECTLQLLGRINGLVNNAGYAIRGAIEETSERQVQEMFDTNVFGVMRLVRAVVPPMREQKAGCIINVSSIAGKRSTPANGAYSASKFALEALSDALRLELAPFGIKVVVIEPGSIRTHFMTTAIAHTPEQALSANSPYRMLYRQSELFAEGMQRHQSGPEAVSRVIQQVIETDKPKARYLVAIPLSGRLILYLGDSFWDYALRRMFPSSAVASHE
ncbi:MAG: SDR family oxidoreductase [Chloroflexi bacterium]|nr:SDR family oxidoreductase [Chloroflexota bacterium]